MRTAAFASGLRGPVDFKALRRLASICLMVAIYVSYSFFEQTMPNGRFLRGTLSCFSARRRIHLALIPTVIHTISRRGSDPNHAYLKGWAKSFVLRCFKAKKKFIFVVTGKLAARKGSPSWV